MKRLKVVLLVPNFKWSDWDINTFWHYIPYNLCLLAALIENSCAVVILDAHKLNMSEEGFKSALLEMKPDVVGITVLMDQYASGGHEAAKLAKSVNKKITVVMGGVYATVNPQIVIKDPNIDFVVIGEGEYVFRDLINFLIGKNPLPERGICYRMNGAIINSGRAGFIEDLDAIPFPAYHLIDFQSYADNIQRKSVDSPRRYPYARMMTSRGCPFGCAFCQVETISGKKFRPRSAKNVLDEIQVLKEKYRVNSLIFDDDNLFTDKKRAKDIFQGMIDRGLAMPWLAIAVAVFKLDSQMIKLMQKSGCEYIDVAIESGNERILKTIIRKPVDLEQAKKIVRLARREGIYVAVNFIVGFPSETWDEIRQTIKFAEEIDADYLKLYAAIPLRNTRLWKICEEQKVFKKDFKDTDIRWSTGQIETADFSANDLTILRAYEWERINFTDPRKRARTALMMGITEEELYDIRRRTLNDACRLIK